MCSIHVFLESEKTEILEKHGHYENPYWEQHLLYDKAVLLKSANPIDIGLPKPMRSYYSIWESYIADLNPTDSNMTFRADIRFVDGGPQVTGDPLSPNRRYTVLGKESLTNGEWRLASPESRFFKVCVDLP